MAYLDRPSRNWGALVATVLAVPAGLVWILIEIVGGSLACEGGDGPCGPSAIGVAGGIAVIGAVASAIGWAINRAIDWVRGDRRAR